jgi:hypothetical protein
MRRLCSLAVALQLSFAGACKKDEEAPPPTATAPSSSSDPAPPVSPATPTSPTVAVTPNGPSYAAKLEDVLALVPKGATTWAIVRDPGALLRGAAWVLDAERKSLEAFVAAAEAAGQPALPELRTFLAKYGPLVAQLAGDLQLDRGVAVAGVHGEPVLVFAATASDALVKALTTAGLELPADLLTCRSLPEPAGIVACAADAKALDGLVLGAASAERLAQLEAKLPGVDLQRANIIAVVDGEKIDEGVALTVETTPGHLQIGIQVRGAPAELRNALVKGSPTAFGAVAPGSTFMWFRLDPSLLATRMATVPAPFDAVVKTFTGEFLFTSVTDPFAFVVLLGVTDPQPFRGAMALTMLGLGGDKVPLPDGTSIEVKLENVATEGGTVQAVRASLGDRPELAQFAPYGVKSEAFSFATDQWMALALGTDATVVPKLAKVSGTGPSAELLASLPEGLARALSAGEVMFAWHLPLDGLQSPSLRASTAAAVAALPKGTDPMEATVVTELLDLLAPLSTASAWLTWNELGPQVQLAVRGFSDPTTEEGKAAQVALADVDGGNDASARYGALADRFADSPRALSYRMRAGRVAGAEGGALAAVALVGMLAAIAIPAAVKYSERAAGG